MNRETMKKWAHQYLKRGWKPVPCRLEVDYKTYGDDKKHPDFGLDEHGKAISWKKVAPSEEFIDSMIDDFKACGTSCGPNALAIQTGKTSNLLVLDLDQPINRAYKWLDDAGIKIYGDSFTVETQSGGHQIYFAFPEGLEDFKTTKAKIFGEDSPVDLRGEGGIVFAAPSEIYDRDAARAAKDGDSSSTKKKFYRLLPPAQGKKYKIHNAPEDLIRIIKKRKTEHVENVAINKEACSKDLASITEGQRSVLNKLLKESGEAPKGLRSDADYSLLKWCIKIGLSEGDTKQVCSGVGKFREKKEQGYLDDYFNSVYTGALQNTDAEKRYYGKGQEGLKSRSQNLGLLKKEDEIKSEVNRLLGLMSKPRDFKDINYVCDPIMARGQVAMLFAPPGLGKTIITCDMVRDMVDTGTFWGGRYSMQRTPKVLLIHTEKSALNSYNRYLKRIGIADNTLVKFLHLRDFGEGFLLDKPHCQKIMEGIIEGHTPDICVIDTIGYAVSNENDNEEVKSIMRWLNSITERRDMYTWIVSHPRKGSNFNPKDKFGRLSADDLVGASSWSRFTDAVYGINSVLDEATGEASAKMGYFHVVKEGSTGNQVDFQEFNFKIHDQGAKLEVEYLHRDGGDIEQEINVLEFGVYDTATSNAVSIEANLVLTIEDLIKRHKRMTGPDLKKALMVGKGCSRSTYARAIKKLKDDGTILAQGSTRTMVYTTSDADFISLTEDNKPLEGSSMETSNKAKELRDLLGPLTKEGAPLDDMMAKLGEDNGPLELNYGKVEEDPFEILEKRFPGIDHKQPHFVSKDEIYFLGDKHFITEDGYLCIEGTDQIACRGGYHIKHSEVDKYQDKVFYVDLVGFNRR